MNVDRRIISCLSAHRSLSSSPLDISLIMERIPVVVGVRDIESLLYNEVHPHSLLCGMCPTAYYTRDIERGKRQGLMRRERHIIIFLSTFGKQGVLYVDQ